MPREGQDHRLMKDFFNMSLHSNYRKLRPFSGSLSPSRDEDGFDLWVDQAEGQLQEWTAAGLEEVEKRRRISEALRTPCINHCEGSEAKQAAGIRRGLYNSP